jgi:hypothetical protein
MKENQMRKTVIASMVGYVGGGLQDAVKAHLKTLKIPYSDVTNITKAKSGMSATALLKDGRKIEIPLWKANSYHN